MDNGTPPRRPRSAYVVSDAAFSHALAVALATPIREGDVAVSREPYPPAIRVEAQQVDRDALVIPVVTDPITNYVWRFALHRPAKAAAVVTDALAHLRRPKREGNRAERRAKGRGR